jgi:exosortase E/protease (VPEID-CTERM system)
LLPQQSHSEQRAEAGSAGLSFSTISTPFKGSAGTLPKLYNTGRPWLRAAGFTLLLAIEYLLYDNLHIKTKQWCLAFALSFFVLSFTRLKSRIRTIPWTSSVIRVPVRYLLLHACSLAILLALPSPFPAEYRLLTAVIWSCAGTCALYFAAVTFFPIDVWRYLFRGTGPLWIYSAVTASAIVAVIPMVQSLWTSSAGALGVDLTFWLVARILHLFIPVVFTDWGQHIIGSDQFSVEIFGPCSGWEGLGLVGMFTVFSLWLSRREYRFPAALILIPIAMALTFALNSVRIAALILIGHNGFPDIAIGGFHSMAGWIAFSGVALGVSLVAPRIGWLRTAQAENQPQSQQTFSNPAVPFLLPFAAILAAGMISMAVAAQFEWLYPLRFVAALAAFWYCRRDYASIPRWKPGWFPVLAGAIVFVVWIGFDRSSHADNGMAAGLAGLPASARITWLLLRTLAAISTVPLAEELAFRGFLLRRIVSPEFESVDFGRWSYVALSLSSLAFGLLHGDRWVVATIAGAIYAIAMVSRRNLWDAFVAHAVTNTMLAAWVLFGHKWYYW